MYTRIVVGTDGSGTAAGAVKHAADLAAAIGAELLVVSAYATPRDAPPTFAASEAPGIDIATGLLEDVEKHYAEQVNLRTIAREGHPADVIIDTAADEGADVIVVGNKGMTGAKRHVLGSVPNTVSHHAPCDVLIARTTE